MNKIKSRHIWILVVLLMVLFDGGYAQASVASATIANMTPSSQGGT